MIMPPHGSFPHCWPFVKGDRWIPFTNGQWTNYFTKSPIVGWTPWCSCDAIVIPLAIIYIWYSYITVSKAVTRKLCNWLTWMQYHSSSFDKYNWPKSSISSTQVSILFRIKLWRCYRVVSSVADGIGYYVLAPLPKALMIFNGQNIYWTTRGHRIYNAFATFIVSIF